MMEERGEQIVMRNFFQEAMNRAATEAHSQGLSQGRTEAQRTIRNRLISMGMSAQDAAAATGLPLGA